MIPDTVPLTLSEKLLLAVKLKDDFTSIQHQLQQLNYNRLLKLLPDDNSKKTFWTNIYNAYYQILFTKQKIRKPEIYKSRLVLIAVRQFSLDDIEHGILRKGKYKYSLGYFSNPFTNRAIKKLAVDKLDYRIHFALNCGAKSCPPIAFYNAAKLDSQLDLATQSFLEAETDYDQENKVLHTTALFKWFHADFGGNNGILDIYNKQLSKDLTGYSIKYKDYSWEDDLENFSASDS